MTKTFVRSIRLLVVVAGLVSAAAPVASAQTSSKSVVTVEAAGPAAPVAAGETFTATISLKIKSGYHINAQKPSEEYLIGTSATITAPRGFAVVRSTYPKARMGSFSFSETPIAVYDGTAAIVVTMKSDASVAAGPSTIPAKVEFQACNDDQCLPPSTVDVTFNVEMTNDGAVGGKQTLTVTGAAPDAKILVDGKAVAVANAQGRAVVREVAVGRRMVRIEATGFAPFEKEVDVRADVPATIAAVLAANVNANSALTTNVNAVSGPTQPVPSTANANSTALTPASSGSGWLLWVLGAVIVAALAGIGIVAATRKSSSTP